MTKREKTLAAVVGVLVVGFAGYWLTSQIRGSFKTRTALRKQIQGEILRKELIIEEGRSVTKQLARFEDLSLPSDVELADSQYQAWLSDVVVRTGLKGPQVKKIATSPQANGATLLTYSVSGEGDLREFASLLFEFYSVNTIHRIRRIPTLRPLPESKQLKAIIQIEALVLSTASPDKNLDSTQATRIAGRTEAELTEDIIQRNLFAPANRPPKLRPVSRQTVELGDSLSIELEARDEDKLDQLTYKLSGQVPDGLQCDSSGQISWKPRKEGNHTFYVTVVDDGIPSKSDERAIEVEVIERSERTADNDDKPKRLAFDEARFAFAIAAVEVGGRRELWLEIRTTGKILKLREGDPIRVGSIDGKVLRIAEHEVDVTTGDETMRIRVGDPLIGVNIASDGL